MFYYLAQFKEYFSPLNVFSYITFRVGGAIITALFFTWYFAPRFIAYLKRKQMTQVIREDGPSTHQAKSGTPTMGGVIILFTMLFSTLLWARLDNRFIWISILTVVYLGAIGFIDDYIKWKGTGGRAKGLTPAYKLAAQMLFALAVITYMYVNPPNPEYLTKINVPYLKSYFINLGIWYVFFAVIIIVGSSNAVNLTDGLDGLAIGSLIISALSYAVFAYVAGNARFSTYLKVIPVAGAGELAVFLSSMIGAGLGFLWYNSYPAEIFMGDTGSLFLGGALGVVSVIVKQELILIIVGGLFVAEASSVLLQVYSFRTRGKRIFKMAPLHHHFELSGWQEPKVTVRFWIVSIVLALIALSSLKLR